MKLIVLLVLAVLFVGASGCTAPVQPAVMKGVSSGMPPDGQQAGMKNASIPNLVGTWTGLTEGDVQGTGFFSHNNGTYVITAQQGYGFSGYKRYIKPGGMVYHENFSGAISPGWEVIMADNVTGYNLGRVTGPDSMELLYAEDGPGARAFIQLFTRVTP